MADLKIPIRKSQIPNKFQLPKSKTPNVLFVICVLELGIYLKIGLPARSRFGEGRCLEFGAYVDYELCSFQTGKRSF